MVNDDFRRGTEGMILLFACSFELLVSLLGPY